MKEDRGTLRPSRENRAEPALEPIAIPDAPDELTPAERKTWERLAKRIDPMRIMTESDLDTFTLLVHAVTRAHQLKNAKNVYAWSAAVKLAVQLLSHFGMSPAMRPKVNAFGSPKKADNDPLSRFTPPWAKA